MQHQRRLNGLPAVAPGPPGARYYSSSDSECDSGSKSSSPAKQAGEAEEANDVLANMLSLQLKKPKHWKWELSTSRSCSNIALPRILLYDHKGELLVDLDSQQEQVVRPSAETPQAPNRKRTNRARAATSNLAQSIRQALDSEFSDLQIKEATPTYSASTRRTPLSSPLSIRSASSTPRSVDFYTNQLPDYKFERRSSSLKGVRFEDGQAGERYAQKDSFHIVDLPTPPSTTTTTATPTTNSSSSGPREKRRYRRSRSASRSDRSTAKSSSILERFSYSKGRSSSPEYAEVQEVRHAPRYFLRTSKAGTLVVQDDSFSRYRRRRRKPRHSSSENLPSETGVRGRSASFAALQTADSQLLVPAADDFIATQSQSLQNVAELPHAKKKPLYPVRRYRSDGNVALHKQQHHQHISSADETAQLQRESREVRPHKRYGYFATQNKRELVRIDSGHEISQSFDNPTAR